MTLVRIMTLQMRIHVILIIIQSILVNSSINAQNPDKSNYGKNEFSIELLGSGVLYSINIEHSFYRKGRIEIKGKTGLMFNPIRIKGLFDYRSIGITIEPKILYEIDQNRIELGVGYTYIYLYDIIEYEEILGCCSDLNLLIPRLGYRRYNKAGRRYFSLSFTPLITLDRNKEGDEWDVNLFIPYGGIGYGWVF